MFAAIGKQGHRGVLDQGRKANGPALSVSRRRTRALGKEIEIKIKRAAKKEAASMAPGRGVSYEPRVTGFALWVVFVRDEAGNIPTPS